MRAFAGIDSSNRTHLVQVIDGSGDCLQKIEIENNTAGFRELAAMLEKWEVHSAGIELTHGPIIDYLNARGVRICPINPLQIRRFKDIYFVSGNKSDSIDALAIARYVAMNHERIRPLNLSSPEIEKLKILGISHDRLVQERSRTINRMHFVLRQYFPLLDMLFSAISCPILLHFLLRFPNWNTLKDATDEEIAPFLCEQR